jgi:hypothetical protein
MHPLAARGPADSRESREIIAEDVVSRNPTMSAAATTVIAAPAHSR